MRRVFYLGVALALLAAGGCGGTAAGTLQADWRIVFSSNRDGDFEIYVMHADGSGAVQLTQNESDGRSEHDDVVPTWSPDGARIAFVSTRDHEGDGFVDGEIYVMRANGSGQTRLTENAAGEGGPDWSPDGRWIAFSRTAAQTTAESPRFELVRMEAEGSEPEKLIDDAWPYGPTALSPDGSTAAFTRCASEKGALDCEIWVAEVDGGEARQLTDAPETSTAPVWSPDGTRIAFRSDRDRNGLCYFQDCTGYNGEIYLMDADGSRQRRLTDDPGDDSSPTWSPDGTRIAFAALRGVEGVLDLPSEDYEIYVMDADGGNVLQITDNTWWDWQPDWR